MAGLDPELLLAWLRGRSLARGLPAPIADRGGWRVDTASAEEERRHVFAAAGDGLRALGEEIARPRVFLKLTAPPGELRALLPPRWSVSQTGHVMICPGTFAQAAPPLPPGYRLETTIDGPVAAATITAGDGSAGRGFAAEIDGVFVFDRIAVDPAHRRLGLGRALMHALGAARRDPAAHYILIATDAGRALYRTLGWADVAPYSTAVIDPATAHPR